MSSFCTSNYIFCRLFNFFLTGKSCTHRSINVFVSSTTFNSFYYIQSSSQRKLSLPRGSSHIFITFWTCFPERLYKSFPKYFPERGLRDGASQQHRVPESTGSGCSITSSFSLQRQLVNCKNCCIFFLRCFSGGKKCNFSSCSTSYKALRREHILINMTKDTHLTFTALKPHQELWMKTTYLKTKYI